MKKKDVKVGRTYLAKVSNKVVRVRVDRESRHGGWNATNLATNKQVRIKSAQRLRAAAGEPSTQGVKGKQAEEKKSVDPNRCATPRCKGRPAVTHLGKPLCQRCWERHCQAESDMETVTKMAANDEVPAPADGATTEDLADATTASANQEENDMATKKTAKSKKTRKGGAKKKASAKTKTPAKPKVRKVDGDKKEKRISALDAAAQVLRKAGKPMHSREMISAMAEQGLWTSPAGKTPHATLYAAMMREARDKGSASRFRKVDRGQFAFNG